MTEDKMIKCPDCGLICAQSKIKLHKSGECFVKIVDTLRGNKDV